MFLSTFLLILFSYIMCLSISTPFLSPDRQLEHVRSGSAAFVQSLTRGRRRVHLFSRELDRVRPPVCVALRALRGGSQGDGDDGDQIHGHNHLRLWLRGAGHGRRHRGALSDAGSSQKRAVQRPSGSEIIQVSTSQTGKKHKKL